jgi:GR25 family glycosyltransferase involved in LPS biosynthesis
MDPDLFGAVMAGMALPVFAINLDGEDNRWSALCANAESIGLDLRRVPAVDGRQIVSPDWERFDLPTARRQNGRKILPTEYGCYQSHLQTLETFLADGSPYGLIIEDDVVFDETTIPRIEAIIAAAPDFDLIKLTNHRTKFFISAAKSSLGDEIGRTVFGPQGSTAAYLVTRDGARKLISQLAVMKLPWDASVERFWDSNLKVYSSRQNVLTLAPSSAVSSIAGPSGSYREGRFPWWKQFGTASFRIKDQFLRMHHVLLRPVLERETSNPAVAEVENSPLKEVVATIAALALISAVWWESDKYRYAGLLLVLFAFVRWVRTDFLSYRKPLIGWAGFLCLGWAIYVFTRLAVVYFTTGQLGSSEGIYLFPALYTTTAYAFLVYIRRPGAGVIWFMILSLAFLAAGTGYTDILQGVRPEPRLFNNPIHAAVAAGIIFLCALQFASYTAQRSDLSPRGKIGYWTLAAAVLLFSAVNVIVLRSKGVWFALAIALLLSALMTVTRRSRRELLAGGGIVALVLAAIVASRNIFVSAAGSTATFITDFFSAVANSGWDAAIEQALTSDLVPSTVQQRLMLWADALEIWRRHPIFGASASWLTEWQDRTYHPEIYDVFHNGYLEIAIRYGFVGLIFYAFLFTWASMQVLRAARAKLIELSAWRCYISTLVFFALTILSNSNNRLAIGESYMWCAAAFGFYCFYLRQRANLVTPRTYF